MVSPKWNNFHERGLHEEDSAFVARSLTASGGCLNHIIGRRRGSEAELFTRQLSRQIESSAIGEIV